jgi:hypothetical protein
MITGFASKKYLSKESKILIAQSILKFPFRLQILLRDLLI